MSREELLEKKQVGDWTTVASMMKSTRDAVKAAFNRPGTELCKKVEATLEQVINQREQLISNNK